MSTKKDPSNLPEELLNLYDKIIATVPELERKGKTMPYTSVNGHMFSFLDKNGQLSIRLSDEDQAAFIKKHKAELSIQHGSVMRGYVVVPEKMLKKVKELTGYFQKSHAYIASLKPKPSKKKK